MFLSCTATEKPKVGPNWRAEKGDHFGFFNTLLQNLKKLKGPFGDTFSEKSLTIPKKLKGGSLRFFNIQCRKTSKQLKGGRFGGKNFFEKSLAKPQKLKGGETL